EVMGDHEVTAGEELRDQRLRLRARAGAGDGEREHCHPEQPRLVTLEIVESLAGRLVESAALRPRVAGHDDPERAQEPRGGSQPDETPPPPTPPPPQVGSGPLSPRRAGTRATAGARC